MTGHVRQVAEKWAERLGRRQWFGLSYLTVQDSNIEAFAAVDERMSGS